MTIDVDGAVFGKKWIVGNSTNVCVFYIYFFNYSDYVDYSIQ